VNRIKAGALEVGIDKRTPRQAIQLAGAVRCGCGGNSIPLLHEEFEVVVDIGLEFEDGLGSKGVGDELPLAGMLSPVARVEETPSNRDEGVVEIADRTLATLTGCSE
jgi:hypothetical protein